MPDEEKVIPKESDPEWTEFVLSHLTKVEMAGEHPKCRGLRRMVVKFRQGIRSSDTVIEHIPIVNNEGNIFYKSVAKHTIETGDDGIYCAVADASIYNTAEKFGIYLSCMAETRAKARCYIEALGLQCNANEEIENNPAVQEGEVIKKSIDPKIDEMQKHAIDTLAAKLNVNIVKLVDSMNMSVTNLSKDDGKKIYKELNNFQRSEDSIKKEFAGYKINWKDNK